jgi:RNA polymerase sigma-70 factor (ECF subfamily)
VIGSDFDAVLAAAVGGDESAVVRLYRDVNPSLVRFLAAQAPGFGDDLAQEVWIAAARQLASFAGDERGFRAWIFTIARRRLIEHWRRSRRRPEHLVDPSTMETVAGSVHAADSAVVGDDAVRSIVAGLSRAQAEIVLLRVVAGFDADEVAQITGKRPGAVRVIQHRALRKLAAQFSEEPVTK